MRSVDGSFTISRGRMAGSSLCLSAPEFGSTLRGVVRGWFEVMAPDEISRRLILMQEEHRDLDLAIDALRSTPGSDQLLLARLKRRKLRFRDEIAILQDMRIPDIIA
jgi:hypothetical protein